MGGAVLGVAPPGRREDSLDSDCVPVLCDVRDLCYFPVAVLADDVGPVHRGGVQQSADFKVAVAVGCYGDVVDVHDREDVFQFHCRYPFRLSPVVFSSF